MLPLHNHHLRRHMSFLLKKKKKKINSYPKRNILPEKEVIPMKFKRLQKVAHFPVYKAEFPREKYIEMMHYIKYA